MKTLILLFALLFLTGCAGNNGFFYERSFWSPMRMYKEACKEDVYITYINGVTYVSIINRHSSAHVTKAEFLAWVDQAEKSGEINQRQANCWRYAVE